MADLSDINIGINVETGDVSRGIRMFDNMKKKIAQMQLELRKGGISNKAYNRGLAQMYQELGKVTGNTRQAQSAVMKYSRSIQEATDEQLRFTSVSGKGMRRMEVLAQQAGYQIGDLAVQIQGGTNAAVALGQQGSQLLGFFGPYGAIAGAALAIGTGLIAPFIRAGKEVEDFQKKATEALEDIKARIAKLKGEDPVLKGYNESIAKSITQATTQLELMNKIRESGKKLKQSEEGIEARLAPIKKQYLEITATLEKQQREKQVYLDTLEEEKTLLYEQDVLAKQREQRITDFFKAEQQMQEEIAQSRVNALLQDNKDRKLQQKEDKRRREENAKIIKKIREERAKADKKAHEVRMGYIALEARSQMLLGTAPMFINEDALAEAAKIFKDRKAAEEAAAKEAGIVEEETISEVAPPSAKAERMVKHIKKGYSKDGKLTDKEKSIAYATAWKQHNKKEEFSGNYQGPLYAPHPDLVEKRGELGLDEGAAWTKKSGKSASGGLNEKGRKSYERENPGSDLKAPSKKVGNPRRKSFCARMKGMKKKLTSKKTASDPDSRINKSLRAWNC